MQMRSYLKHRHFRHNTAGVSYTPKQAAQIYGFPKVYDGTGRSIAFIELGGGLNQAALDSYFHALGLTVKPVIVHEVAGAKNAPGDPNGADGEVMLDLCIGGGMAPGAQLHCVFAPNTDAGFLSGIQAARAALKSGDAISISWGGAESDWDAAAMRSFDQEFQACAAAGILVTAAAGDNGSGDGEPGAHVDFPASSPHVLGCGGTSLLVTPSLVETVWNDGSKGGATGGGTSTVFALPDYQKLSNVPGSKKRGVPDVAGVADPETGWSMINTDSKYYVIGGTSAVAPMWAALAVTLTQALGTSVDLLSLVYALKGWNRDITSGSNGTFVARAGYDCCTGNGVPDVTKLLAAIKAGLAPTVPAPPVAPPPVTPPPATTSRTIVVSGAGVVVSVDGKAV